jgi:hypothetical protein
MKRAGQPPNLTPHLTRAAILVSRYLDRPTHAEQK